MPEELEDIDTVRASRDQYVRMVNGLESHFLYTHDIQGRFTFVSPSVTRVLGYSVQEMITSFESFLTDNPVNLKAGEYTEGSLRGELQPLYEIEARHKDGRLLSIEVMERPVFDAQGDVVAVDGIAQDVTERKQLEAELASEKLQLHKIAKSLDENNAMLKGLSSKLSKYLSPQVYDSIFSGKQEVRLVTKRKKLSIFFSDIKDFTAITDDLEPEDVTFLINDYLSEMSEIALEHGATIDKFIGDAILIFFGDPTSKGVSEDALTCVRMAIAMQRRMMSLRAKWAEMGYERSFQMRIGINTGYCNVGNFGSEERMDYTIIGGEVNLAARLEGIADPDGITLSYETYSLVKDFIDAQREDPISVKGIHRKVSPYKLIGIYRDIDEASRFVRSEAEGMKLFLDFDKLDEVTRPNAIKELETALDRLTGAERLSNAKS